MEVFKIGIIGKAGRSSVLPDKLFHSAKVIGKEIAKNNHILVTGACMGVSAAASESASNEKGIILSYSPAKDLKTHIEPPIFYPWPQKREIPLFTGLGKVGRSFLFINECDGVIVVGGGIGTLNEFAIALHEGKVIGVLEGMGGVVEKIISLESDFKKGTAKDIKAVIVREKDPKKLVAKVIAEIKKRKEKPRKEIPITFKNKKGKELVGVVHLPEREKPPLVIIAHGFQGTKSEKKFVSLARSLQKAGILVFRFDFEGCGDSQGEPSRLTVADEVSDFQSAFKVVLSSCHIDSQRIGFFGYSLGAVVSGLFAQNTKPKTLVFWSPAFNQRSLFKLWYSKEDIDKIKNKGVIYKKEKEIGRDYYLENKHKDYSFIFSKLKIPILILHGTKDKDVPIENSQKITQKYKNITLLPLRGSDHKIENVFLQKRAIKLTTEWFKKYLILKQK